MSLGTCVGSASKSCHFQQETLSPPLGVKQHSTVSRTEKGKRYLEFRAAGSGWCYSNRNSAVCALPPCSLIMI